MLGRFMTLSELPSEEQETPFGGAGQQYLCCSPLNADRFGDNAAPCQFNSDQNPRRLACPRSVLTSPSNGDPIAPRTSATASTSRTTEGSARLGAEAGESDEL
jgi:hypothetical protein